MLLPVEPEAHVNESFAKRSAWATSRNARLSIDDAQARTGFELEEPLDAKVFEENDMAEARTDPVERHRMGSRLRV